MMRIASVRNVLICLLLTTCLAGCGGGPKADPNGRAAAEWVLGRDGTVTIAEIDYPLKRGAELPEGAVSVVRIDLNGKGIADADLQKLAGLTNVVALGLHSAKLSEKGLDPLLELKSLQEIELSNTRIGDAGLQKLSALPALTKVFVYNTHVTADGAKTFQEAKPGCTVFR